MKITKLHPEAHTEYMFYTGNNHSSFFDTFKSTETGVELYIGNVIATVLHFSQANEFYIAWRTYQCST